ncbi:MAG: low molecular weight phosphotyrosine protein phosphatase [Gammaproteobacteria bacterium]|nr:low molecular weight phosphotyrosine protein phosphatase [Gammaproteobacteria bacterium]
MSSSDEITVIKVLMVCLGNICRSPTAHGVFQQRINSHNLQNRIMVDSAGTGDWHIGQSPDHRAASAAKARGYPLDDLRARQVQAADFHEYDYILAMDHENLSELKASCPEDCQHKLALFLSYSDREEEVVPDPYYSGDDGFELVLDMVEEASDNLLNELVRRHLN